MLRLRELVAYAMDLSSFFCPIHLVRKSAGICSSGICRAR